MCIISKPVQSVSKTQIFAMPVPGERQLTVYKNHVSSREENLMILPVPYPDTIEFHTNPFLLDIFTDLHRSLYWTSESRNEMPNAWTRSATMLPVMKIGSYRVSVVPSAEEFNRLDPSVFAFPYDLQELLNSYSPLFGFVCCRLNAGGHEYEPLAYTHKQLYTNELFLPTRHYHPNDFGIDADWDHEIYTLRTYQDAHRCDGVPKQKNHLDRLSQLYPVHPAEPVHCWKKVGLWDNVDISFPIKL
jgi:hypothetical protein